MLCEVCSNILNGPTLDLGSYPLCDDLNLIDDTSKPILYRQAIQLCTICLTAHQLYPVVKHELFKSNYHYRSALTNDVLLGMKDLAKCTIERISVAKKLKILDVGCNDGSLLEIFKQYQDCTTVGVDPTDAIDQAVSKVDYCFKAFFDLELSEVLYKQFGKFDVITFTNVFAHIENLPALIEALKLLIDENTLVVIENHYLGSILESNQFDTFYHEHPRTYSFKSFIHIAESLGLKVVGANLTRRYGGNIRVMLQTQDFTVFDSDISLLDNEKNFVARFSDLQFIYENWKHQSRIVIDELLLTGPIIGKSLPGRAVMLINSLKLAEGEMEMVLEKTASPKVGHLVPGTTIPIFSDDSVDFKLITRIVIWAWHINEEIVDYLTSLGYTGEIWVPLPEFKRIR